MARKPAPDLHVTRFDDHQIITQANPLLRALRPHAPVEAQIARAEEALAALSGEFASWMAIECERVATAHAAMREHGINAATRDELFRAAHDIKGDAATFGFPAAATIAESLCRIIEHAPDLADVPDDLIEHHVNAIQAIVRERATIGSAAAIGDELCARLRKVADSYLVVANRQRPDHLDAVLAPSIVPAC